MGNSPVLLRIIMAALNRHWVHIHINAGFELQQYGTTSFPTAHGKMSLIRSEFRRVWWILLEAD